MPDTWAYSARPTSKLLFLLVLFVLLLLLTYATVSREKATVLDSWAEWELSFSPASGAYSLFMEWGKLECRH